MRSDPGGCDQGKVPRSGPRDGSAGDGGPDVPPMYRRCTARCTDRDQAGVGSGRCSHTRAAGPALGAAAATRADPAVRRSSERRDSGRRPKEAAQGSVKNGYFSSKVLQSQAVPKADAPFVPAPYGGLVWPLVCGGPARSRAGLDRLRGSCHGLRHGRDPRQILTAAHPLLRGPDHSRTPSLHASSLRPRLWSIVGPRVQMQLLARSE